MKTKAAIESLREEYARYKKWCETRTQEDGIEIMMNYEEYLEDKLVRRTHHYHELVQAITDVTYTFKHKM